jgi:riboflavin kinase / FMN adenylyltransferase
VTEIAWEHLQEAPVGDPAAVTVGVFDGLHTGHRELIRNVVDSPWTPVVVTFERHPTELLLHDSIPGFIMSLRQKRVALRELGVAVGVFVDFTEEFRLTPGAEFFRALGRAFDLRRLVVGHDFRCGYRLDTGVDEMRALFRKSATEVVDVGPVELGNEPVSSTRIRSLVLEGRLAEAHRLLGRPYTLDLGEEVVEVDESRAYIVKGRGDLLPGSRQLLPPPGEYDARVSTAAEPSNDAVTETVLQIGENSLSWPLVAGGRIQYIVIKDRRLTSKE